MEDIEMNNNTIKINQFEEVPEKQEEEDSCVALDNIQKELKLINETFNNSLMHIKNFSPFIEKGSEQNMENEQHGFRNLENYEQNRENFDNALLTYGNQMNEHFDKLLEMTKKLKNYEEFNMTEKQLKQKLENLKEDNKKANEEMSKKLKNIDNIYNNLNADSYMNNEINIRNDFDDNIEI